MLKFQFDSACSLGFLDDALTVQGGVRSWRSRNPSMDKVKQCSTPVYISPNTCIGGQGKYRGRKAATWQRLKTTDIRWIDSQRGKTVGRPPISGVPKHRDAGIYSTCV